MRQADSVSPTEGLQVRTSAQSKFRPDIEGLRAVAVLAVVLFHADLPGLRGGYLGVDVFFVISGFLITGLLWREINATGTVRMRSFYGARARRLLPASAFVGIVTTVASALLLPALQVPTALKDGIASALYVGNYWFIFENVNYFADLQTLSPFQHYWSLGVEEQFYLVWAPLILGTMWVVRLVRRRTRVQAAASQGPYLLVLVLVAVMSFAMSLVLTYVSPIEAFFSLPTRAWQLALGGLVALTAIRWRRRSQRTAAITGWTGLGLIVLSYIWFTSATPSPGAAALLPTVGAVLVIGAGCAAPTQGCGRLLGWAPLQAIGRISYSWYLWHWPVLVLAPALVGHPLGLPARLFAALISGGLAWLTLRLLENPLRFAPTIRNSAWRSLGLGGLASALAVCVGMALLAVAPSTAGHGAPASPVKLTATPVPAGSSKAAYDAVVQRLFGQVQAAVSASVDLKAVPSNLDPPLGDPKIEQTALRTDGCLREVAEPGQPDCAAGDVTSSTTVALVGDSHAAMWNPAFKQIATERHWRLEMLAKGGCPLMEVPSTNPFRSVVEQNAHCQQWRSQILTRLSAERPRLVVVSMFRGYDAPNERPFGLVPYDTAWLDGLTRLVHQLRSTGARVLVLGPVPDPHRMVPICLSAHLDDVTACSPARSTAVNERGITAEAAATEAAGGRYTDLTDLFCTADRCPVIVGNTQVFMDGNHLTSAYSRLLAPVFGALSDRALAYG